MEEVALYFAGNLHVRVLWHIQGTDLTSDGGIFATVTWTTFHENRLRLSKMLKKFIYVVFFAVVLYFVKYVIYLNWLSYAIRWFICVYYSVSSIIAHSWQIFWNFQFGVWLFSSFWGIFDSCQSIMQCHLISIYTKIILQHRF